MSNATNKVSQLCCKSKHVLVEEKLFSVPGSGCFSGFDQAEVLPIGLDVWTGCRCRVE